MRAALCKGWLLATMLAATGPAAAMHPSTAGGAQVAETQASPGSASATAAPASAAPALPPPGFRNGLEIYENFRDGLAQPECEADASTRWRQHFANAPSQLATPGSDVLPLFGYVVDALRAEHLPTEYALIPFVESGYRPGATSPSGPAGLWQFIAVTARNHKVPIVAGYDGRLSPVDSTTAAVRYLKTLHGMFAGDWRLAVMAYNAGEYRVLAALRRAGQVPASAEPDALAVPAITRAYVRKLHAIACVLREREAHDTWLDALDRPVPLLVAVPIPAGTAGLDALARQHGTDATRLRRLNPVFGSRGFASVPRDREVLAPAGVATSQLVATHRPSSPLPTPVASAGFLNQAPDEATDAPAPAGRVHTVARGDSAWKIARRYEVRLDQLLSRNGLAADGVLRPGMRLRIDEAQAGPPASGVAE